MHVRHEHRPGVADLLVHVEDALRGDLRTRRIGAVRGSKPHVLEFFRRLVGVRQPRFGQRRIAPSLKSVIPVERGLSVADKMQMENHTDDYSTLPACHKTRRAHRHRPLQSANAPAGGGAGMRGMTGGGSQLNGTARTQSLPIRPADSLSSRVPHQAKNTPKSHGVVQAIAG